MLDQIINVVKDQAVGQLMGNADVPNEKVDEVAGAAGESVVDGLKGALGSGDISGLTSLLGGNAGDLGSNNIVQGMVSNFAGKLTGLTGMGGDASSSLAGGMLPGLIQSVISKFTSSAPGDSAFDVNSLMASAGSNMLADKAKDLLGGGIGDLFGK